MELRRIDLMSSPLAIRLIFVLFTGAFNAHLLHAQSTCPDLAVVKTAFRTHRGHPRYNVHADLNSDGVIDLRDLAFAAKRCQVDRAVVKHENASNLLAFSPSPLAAVTPTLSVAPPTMEIAPGDTGT